MAARTHSKLPPGTPVSILCIADEVDALVYSQNVKERFGHVSLVLAAGDIKMKYLGFISSMLNKTIYFVFGNHDLKFYHHFRKDSEDTYSEYSQRDFERNYFGSTYVGDKVLRDRKTGLIIAGLGGSMRYSTGINQYSDYQMYRKVLKLIPKMLYYRVFYGRWVDILLTHAPPFGIHDQPDRCHTGFRAFLWFMRKFRPQFLLHGHVHLHDINSPRESAYHDTRIINVYSRYVLEVTSR